MRLDMVGDGPMLPGLKAEAEALGVSDAVTFHGWMEHGAVQDVLAGSDLMAFPSIREFGGGVVLEAMALGVPSLIVDYAGPAELLTEGTGWKVPLGDRATIVAGFRAELERLEQDRPVLAKAGRAGLGRVAARFTWDRKADQISEVYKWILGERNDRPEPMADRQNHAAE
jgi:glycosyltransferase involved in cell wall biosynthesis